MDIATIELRLEAAQALRDADRFGARLDRLGEQGERAATRIAVGLSTIGAPMARELVGVQDLERQVESLSQTTSELGNAVSSAAEAVAASTETLHEQSVVASATATALQEVVDSENMVAEAANASIKSVREKVAVSKAAADAAEKVAEGQNEVAATAEKEAAAVQQLTSGTEALRAAQREWLAQIPKDYRDASVAAEAYAESLRHITKEELASRASAYDKMFGGVKATDPGVSAASGREAAKAMAAAMEQEFKLEMARIKEGVARGFLTPAEAKEAGRQAAMSYNQGIVAALDKGGAAKAFMGKEGEKSFVQIAGSLKAVDDATRRAHGGLGNLRQELGTVTRNLLSLNPAVAQTGLLLGNMAIGQAHMIAILGGIAALSMAYDKLTESARRAAEEQRRIKSVGDDHLSKIGRPAGDIGAAATQAAEQLAELERKRAPLQNQRNSLVAQRDAGSEGLGLAIATLDGQLEKLNAEYKTTSARVTVLNDETKRLTAAHDLAAKVAGLNVERQHELNTAFGQSASELQKINARYDLKQRLAEIDAQHTGAEAQALKALAHEYAEATARAQRLAEVQARADAARSNANANETMLRAARSAAELARAEEAVALAQLSGSYAAERAQTALDKLRIAKDAEAKRAAADIQLQNETRRASEEDKRAAIARYDATMKAIDAEEQIRQATAASGAEVRRAIRDQQDYEAALQKTRDAAAQQAATLQQLVEQAHTSAVERQAKAWSETRDTLAGIVDLVGQFDSGTQSVAAAALRGFEAWDRLSRMMEERRKNDVTSDKSGSSAGARDYAAVALSSAAMGYGIGSATGNRSAGLFGGAAAGAFAGSALGPWGGVIGGLAGAAAGLLGASKAQKEAADQLKQAQFAFQSSLTTWGAQVGFIRSNNADPGAGSSVYAALAQNAAMAARMREESRKVYGGDVSEINAIEARGAQKISDDFWASIREQLNATKGEAGVFANQMSAIDKAFEDAKASAAALFATAEQLAEIDELYANQKAATEAAQAAVKKAREDDIAVRMAAATGMNGRDLAELQATIAAERELSELRRAGVDPEIIAQYQQVQDAEKKKREEDFAQTAKDIQADAEVRRLRATGMGDEAERMALQIQHEREIRELQQQGFDEATIAAVAFAQAAEDAALAAQQAQNAINRALGDIASDVSFLGLSGQQAIDYEKGAFGFGGLSDEEIRKLYTAYDPNKPLTDDQRRQNQNVQKYFEDKARFEAAMGEGAAVGMKGTDSYSQQTIASVTQISASQAATIDSRIADTNRFVSELPKQTNFLSLIEEHTRRMALFGGSPGAFASSNWTGPTSAVFHVYLNGEAADSFIAAIDSPQLQRALDRGMGSNLNRNRQSGGQART